MNNISNFKVLGTKGSDSVVIDMVDFVIENFPTSELVRLTDVEKLIKVDTFPEEVLYIPLNDKYLLAGFYEDGIYKVNMYIKGVNTPIYEVVSDNREYQDLSIHFVEGSREQFIAFDISIDDEPTYVSKTFYLEVHDDNSITEIYTTGYWYDAEKTREYEYDSETDSLEQRDWRY